MAQNYNTSYKLGNANKEGLCKIYVRVTGRGQDIKIPTAVKVKNNQFDGITIKGHTNKVALIAVIEKEKRRVEDLILQASLKDIDISKDYLIGNTAHKSSLKEYIKRFLLTYQNKATRKARASLFNKLPAINVSQITGTFLKEVETSMFDANLDQNTISSQMTKIKTLMLAMIKDEVITNAGVIAKIRDYKAPAYLNKIPEYLTAEELIRFEVLVNTINNEQKKSAGYYFLLSCFTGWRLQDLKNFNYENSVKDGMVVLRASKNNKIVAIPIYPRLEAVLNYCKDNKLNMTEQHFRLYVKEIAADIGISQVKRNIKIHTGRHTFAMMLIDKGFSIDEVAVFLGDGPDVARVYARITNIHLSDKVKQRLF